MALVVVLAKERLEFTELVSYVTIRPWHFYQLKVMTKVIEVPLHLRLRQ
jgi:hypothetical protein